MPLEIREIVIRTNIIEDNSRSAKTELSEKDLKKLKKEIFADCMEKIEEVLNRYEER